MNRHLITFLLALGAVALGGTKLQAQSYRLGSDVPFAFHVNNSDCGSGTYIVQRQAPANFDTLRNKDGGCAIFVASGAAQLSGAGSARLVFHKYGDQYFLREIWDGTGLGHKVPETKLERETRQAQVTVQMSSTTIELASLR
jgi:hypothetical protein